MKRYALTIILLMLVLPDAIAKIRNGYENEIARAKLSIRHIRQLLADNPQYSARERRKLQDRISMLTDVLVYHQLTDTLLYKFRVIAPDLYAEIDTIKDHMQRDIDVYVKFIPRSKSRVMSSGAVTLSAFDEEDFYCVSEHGKGTVSVTIWLIQNALTVLSHEFGHLRYMIPNIEEYLKFYKGTYIRRANESAPGHECGDAGGLTALRYESRYRRQYGSYIRDRHAKISPYNLVTKLRESVRFDLHRKEGGIYEAVAGPVTF